MIHKSLVLRKIHGSVRLLDTVQLLVLLPYSPDMAAADFFLFSKLKLPLRGTHFQSIEDIKENSRRELKSIPANAFKKCFDDSIGQFPVLF